MGAWIEIAEMWAELNRGIVAPLVGAWIEISRIFPKNHIFKVAPLVGAWIEMSGFAQTEAATMSLPLWERGLKFSMLSKNKAIPRRSPCGSVD